MNTKTSYLLDLLFSTWIVRPLVNVDVNSSLNIRAPKLDNSRHKIIWSDQGIQKYQETIVPHLSRLQILWLSTSPTKSSMQLLLQATNEALTTCARSSNHTIDLSLQITQKSKSIPRKVRLSARKLKNIWRKLTYAKLSTDVTREYTESLESSFKRQRYLHRKLVRMHLATDANSRDENLLRDPKLTYRKIRKSRRTLSGKVCSLKVGEKLYTGEQVPDGFYESVLKLKTKTEDVDNSQYFHDFKLDYLHILEMCRSEARMAPITDIEALKILERMKPDVLDFFSVTPYHYLYAGPAGWQHFTLLLNALIYDLSNIDLSEVNRAYACILFKGHGRDKTSSRSYRTISSCPVVAKALDILIRDRHVEQWNLHQAPTQFQGEGSSHELAGILLTECVQYSLHTLKRPMFALYLDAQSAFDVVQRELLIKNLYDVQGASQDLLYVDKRLAARETVVEWSGSLMGPINDEQGLEQGGINSSEFYKNLW